MDISVLGVDLGKNVCSVVGLDASGVVVKNDDKSFQSFIAMVCGGTPTLSREGALLIPRRLLAIWTL
ncbi:hypothetical protein [Roseiarcus sp.]|uniref:hypothetical protein n=1 Tax=Roseiarcus sp. TaxID=1969460 RepID=UPI003C5F3CE0